MHIFFNMLANQQSILSMNNRILFLFLALLLNFPIGYSNTFFQQYNFITDKLGIPQCLVEDIIKDSDSFIWIAMHEGIGRYDGYEFVKFSTETAPLTLKNNNVQKLCEDNFKRIWIASEGGIDVLDLKTYTLVNVNNANNSFLQELLKEPISTIFIDSSGSIWIATQAGLHCLDFNKQGEIDSYYSFKSESAVSINALTEMNDTIYVGINNEVCSVEKSKNNQLIASPLSSSIPSYSEDWRILCMEVDNDCLWIGSNRGLFRYHSLTGELKRYRYSTHRKGMLSQAYITDIQLTKQGHLI
ncbi:MAG: ligand-binding sensor domain-containing protein, partial [Phocaeicola sp.]